MTRIHRIEVPIPFPLQTVNCYYIPDSNPTLVDTGVNGAEGLDIISAGIRIQRHHRVRRDRALNLLKAEANLSEKVGGLTPCQVAMRLFPYINGVEIFLALSEAVGHLDYLKAKGLAGMQRRAGTRVYRWTAKGD